MNAKPPNIDAHRSSQIQKHFLFGAVLLVLAASIFLGDRIHSGVNPQVLGAASVQLGFGATLVLIAVLKCSKNKSRAFLTLCIFYLAATVSFTCWLHLSKIQ